MKRVFETAECEEVGIPYFFVQKYEKHENQMKGCAVWTESEWLADERVGLVGLWYCKSLARYGGWSACNKEVKEARLNPTCRPVN